MDNTLALLKAIADDTRLKIVRLLLQRNYCVGALARHLGLTEAAISQHLKILREAGLIIGERRGYFMHYYVEPKHLLTLASEFEKMAAIQRQTCKPEEEDCTQKKRDKCHVHESGKECSEKVHLTSMARVQMKGRT
ncbi:MAG: winged helix-turn-helix transcriptional regulator [Clostridiaceae bacterium]|nr:winged helix-turn-helix transcriptional regulator [Clostridiaceae bacterium]